MRTSRPLRLSIVDQSGAVDDEIGRWLDAGHHADITLRQLATHTSGLPRLTPSHILGAPDPYEFLTLTSPRRTMGLAPSKPAPRTWPVTYRRA